MTALKATTGRVALVTGAARGIGLSIARRFAADGVVVAIADLNEDFGRKAAAEISASGGKAHFIRADLSVTGGAARMVGDVVALAGRIDVLINNARAGNRRALLDESEENWDVALDVGLKAAFFAAQAAIPEMAKLGGGCIVNIASVAATLATHESPAYHVSKAGLLQLTRYLAVAAGPQQVRVNCVMPGFIVQEDHRPRFESAANEAYRKTAEFYQPMGQIGAEADVAELVSFLCSSSAHYISGACLPLDGGASIQEQFGLLMRWPGTGGAKQGP
ncbi:MAG: hypothetical protein RL077_2285 [Verrucomicrobiota bacterium]|jgi:3-oxoacyl-[acyl-carrier protein] reductase